MDSVLVSEAIASAESKPDLLEQAVHEHARLVYRIAYSVLRNHHDAEDATQETFVRVLRYGSRLAQVDDRRSWLARIAWRVTVEHQRRARLPHSDLAPEQIEQLRSSIASAEEQVLGSEISELLEKMIAALPGKLRDPLVLSTVEELSPADIAAVLGIREAAVRSRIFRARQALKEKMAFLLEKKHAG